MAALSLPWQASTLSEAIEAAREREVPPLQGDYSDGLKNFIHMCLEKSPEKRPNINRIVRSDFGFAENL